MAFQIGKSSGSASQVPTTLAEINVTPLVDVMLVLLIVFMVSAPLMQQGVQVDLPKANAGSLNEAPEQVILVVNRGGQVSINGTNIATGTLFSKLQAMSAAHPNIEVFIQGDQGVPYGVVAQVMAEVKRAKIQRVGLVTMPGDPNHKI